MCENQWEKNVDQVDKKWTITRTTDAVWTQIITYDKEVLGAKGKTILFQKCANKIYFQLQSLVANLKEIIQSNDLDDTHKDIDGLDCYDIESLCIFHN